MLFRLVLALCCGVAATASVPAYTNSAPLYRGFDLSSLKIEEDGGAVYKDTSQNNATRPVEAILEGMNTVRLRLWVHPVVPYDDGCKSSRRRSFTAY